MNPRPLDCRVATLLAMTAIRFVIASEAWQSKKSRPLDCRVATLLAMTAIQFVIASEARQSKNSRPLDCRVANAPRIDGALTRHCERSAAIHAV